jgi:hypothetical protein
LAVIPADIHPALESCGLASAGYGQFPTCVRAFQTICSPIDKFKFAIEWQVSKLPS